MSPTREQLRTRLAQARTVPTVATLHVLAATTGFLYLTGGLFVLLASLVTTRWAAVNMTGVRVVAGSAVLIGALVLALGRRLTRPAYHLLVGLGTAVVTALVCFGGGGDASVALAVPYVYVIVDASFFFGALGLACHAALVVIASAESMTLVGLPLADIVMVEGFLLGVSVVVAWLARVADLAEQDSLTRLVNRRGFDRRLEAELARRERNGGQLALVMLDVDNFKLINDTVGHLGGDLMLGECAAAWQQMLEDGQVLSRFGGDEFAVLLPHCSLGRAADIADRLRELAPEGLSVSAGVACWHPGDTASVLLGRVDVALYDAKSAGRAQTMVYGDPSRGASELEAAIAGGELVLHYQPVIRLADGAIVGTEALVRWNHPRRGMVPPMEFIPQAERTGAIHALGLWTLERACWATARACGDRGVNVNVSVPELRNPQYVDAVRQILRVNDLRPNRLTLEVTEALFDDDDPQVVRTLQSLRELGVKVAIDDFGTGYSSLRWLEQFPVDVVKIDRSFVGAISTATGHHPVLSAIIAICRALGMRVVAEGVETPAQAAMLRELGCDLAQGYLFGRPVPLAELPSATSERVS